MQPPVTLLEWNRPDLHGLRLGIYRAWFEHASPEVVKVCSTMVDRLQDAGAEIREINVPELDKIRVAHAVTILSEMAVCMRPYRQQRKQHGASVRLSLVLGEGFTASDYLLVQRMRTRALAIFRQIFEQVDVVISPATALAAQPIPPGGLESGWSDLGTVVEMMRYIFPGNLTGMPAISFPAGYDGRGLPIGMQAMGSHWEEHVLLRVAYVVEQVLQRHAPDKYFPVF